MMLEFWNERYAANDYAYGEAPNSFFAKELNKLEGGRILFPAEGEGRNAVHAASRGFDVVAFDPSKTGQQKALQLARKNNTSIEYLLESYESINLAENSFDGIVLIFAHMPAHLRQRYHQRLLKFLKPGGILILQGFSKEQIKRNTGGPPNIEMLFSEKEMKDDFKSLTSHEIDEVEVNLHEGDFHNGIASVIQLIGIK